VREGSACAQSLLVLPNGAARCWCIETACLTTCCGLSHTIAQALPLRVMCAYRACVGCTRVYVLVSCDDRCVVGSRPAYVNHHASLNPPNPLPNTHTTAPHAH